MTANRAFDATQLFNLHGQVGIVTGAARGNGRAIAEGLAAVGVKVVLTDLLDEELEQARQVIEQRGGQAVAVRADLTKLEDLRAIVNCAIEHFGQIDILVNCAGVSFPERSSEDYPDDKWVLTMAVNVDAAFRLGKLVAKHMISRCSGSIINITSIGATLGFPNNPAYQASKGALQQLTRAFANDWARHNIRVNNLCPGYFMTAMTKKSWSNPGIRDRRAARLMLNRWGNPAELVGPVIFLASKAASYMTGNDLYIDGGLVKTGILEGQ